MTRRYAIVIDALGVLTGVIRRWARALCFAGLVGLIILAGQGCGTVEQRYEVLSFFFDGVPVPESLKDKYPAEDTAAGLSPWDPNSRAAQPAEPERIEYVFHRPYANRNCFGCHDREGGYAMLASNKDLCRGCHSAYYQREPGDWLHGPVIMGECRMCHEPHKSEQMGLLVKAQPELCQRCHDPAFLKRDPYHRTLTDLTCSNCHDPHGSGNRQLLADARTYSRNANSEKRIGTDHPDWGKGQCAMCHQTDAAMVLVEDVNSVCVECHADQMKVEPGAPLHEPVARGQCVTCHTPHDSPRPHLIRPVAEQMCVTCHPLEKVNTPDHPRVKRVDCVLCHQGHRVTRPAMLREGVGQPVLDAPPPAATSGDGTVPAEPAAAPDPDSSPSPTPESPESPASPAPAEQQEPST